MDEFKEQENEALRVSEREQLATIMELMILVEDAKEKGKTAYTADEVLELLSNFARQAKERCKRD